MKRAEVWKSGDWWHVDGFDERGGTTLCDSYATHEDALAAALAEVGLDRPAEHREAP